MFKKLVCCLFIVLLLDGCATANLVPFKVDSVPTGAEIDVNGSSMGMTPLEIELQCNKHWIGLMNSADGWSHDNLLYEVTAYPSNKLPGLSQTKKINPCETLHPPGHIQFDLSLDKVAPKTRLDVNLNENGNKNGIEDTLRSLKKLHEQGILSDDEYHAKVNAVVNSVK